MKFNLMLEIKKTAVEAKKNGIYAMEQKHPLKTTAPTTPCSSSDWSLLPER